MKKVILLAFFLSAFLVFNAQEKRRLKPHKRISISISEPSDICLAEDKQSYFVVSDKGTLFQLDLDFKVIKKSDLQFYDSEAVFHYKGKLYVVEERTRLVKAVDFFNDELLFTKEVSYTGARNKGFESICFNPAKERFLLVTEKNPIIVFEISQLENENFTAMVTNRVELNLKGDISAITFYKGRLYALSDENQCVYRLNPKTYSTEIIYNIPVSNAEGICFSPTGDMVIVSDDMQQVYVFEFPVE